MEETQAKNNIVNTEKPNRRMKLERLVKQDDSNIEISSVGAEEIFTLIKLSGDGKYNKNWNNFALSALNSINADFDQAIPINRFWKNVQNSVVKLREALILQNYKEMEMNTLQNKIDLLRTKICNSEGLKTPSKIKIIEKMAWQIYKMHCAQLDLHAITNVIDDSFIIVSEVEARIKVLKENIDILKAAVDHRIYLIDLDEKSVYRIITLIWDNFRDYNFNVPKDLVESILITAGDLNKEYVINMICFGFTSAFINARTKHEKDFIGKCLDYLLERDYSSFEIKNLITKNLFFAQYNLSKQESLAESTKIHFLNYTEWLVRCYTDNYNFKFNQEEAAE